MQSEHTRPKIASSSRKLPQAFISSSRTMAMMPGKKSNANKQQSNNVPAVSDVPSFKKPQQAKKKKNKNPLLHVRQCIKMMRQFEDDMNSLQQQHILSDKYSKLNLENKDFRKKKSDQTENDKVPMIQKTYSEPVKQKRKYSQAKIKYENCITLSQVKRSQKGCIKKVLYVPKLTMHFLKQVPINSQIDKSSLHEWIDQINLNTSKHGIKIIELFWNIPEGFYTLMYDYYEGSFLKVVMEDVFSLPFSVIWNIIKCHIESPEHVYQSYLFIGNSQQSSKQVCIKYLPFFQEQEMPGSSSQRIRQYQQEQQEQHSQSQIKASNVLVGNLGILLLFCYFGEVLVQQDFNELVIRQKSASQKPCCLLHELLSVENSLTKALLNNSTHKSILPKFVDLLCKLLKYNSNQQMSLKDIKQSSFMRDGIPQEFPSYDQIKQALQFNPETDSLSKTINIANNKQLNQILDAIQLILQNVKPFQVKVELTESSFRMQRLARELGLQDHITNLAQQLRHVYKGWI